MTISNARPHERAMRYANDVLSERVIACKKVKMAARRFLRDLERQQDADYPWRFDEKKADRPCDFIERFIRPSKGDYEKMQLLDWQCFCECNLYGWVDKQTGLRRYREGLIIVGRGNGKTTLVSGNALYMEGKDDEMGAEVYLLANSKEQARICYEMAAASVSASRALRARYRVLRDGIYYDQSHSLLRPRASDSKKLDGLNTHLGIFDELAEYRDYKLINVIQRSTNKRKQPLLLYITTMGTVLDGALVDFYARFSDAMQDDPPMGQRAADSMFAFIAELDQGDAIDDEACWIKANPSLDVLLPLERLRLDYERCKGTPRMLADFVCKQLNVMVDAREETLVDAQVLARNNGSISDDELLGKICYGGFDLSAREDFTAAALVFPLPDGRFAIRHHSWVPRRKVLLDNEKIDYDAWSARGVLTIADGEYIRQEDVYKWFVEQAGKYRIAGIGYDPANAVTLQRMLDGSGFSVEIIRQGPITLNDPMKEVRALLLDGRMLLGDDPMLRWYFGNVRLRDNYSDKEHENWMPAKKNKYRKIDGFMALLDAYALYLRQCPPQGLPLLAPGVSSYALNFGHNRQEGIYGNL